MQKYNSKNSIRLAFLPFIFDILELLKNQTQYSVQTLQVELVKLSKIASENAPDKDKKFLCHVLKEHISEIMESAKDVETNTIINKNQLLYTLFDGIPLTLEPQIDKPFDIVVEQTPNRSIALVYCPNNSEIYDQLEIQVAAEREYKIPCTNVKIFYPRPESKKSDKVKTKENDETSPDTITPTIGRTLFSRQHPLILTDNSQKDRIRAVVFESHSQTVLPNEYVKVVNEDSTKTIFCRVVKILSQPLSGVGITKKFSELSTVLDLQPLTEKTIDYKGKPRPCDVSGFFLQKLSRNELIEILHVPKSGLPLGFIDYDGITEPFLFPLEPDTSIFQSMTVAGVQGKGKTSFIKLLILGLTSIGKKNGSN